MLRFDINLVFTVINLLVLYFLLKKFLFDRVNKVVNARKKLIEKQFTDAEGAQEAANAMKQDYENKLTAAKDEGDKILEEARARAKEESDRILAEADAELTEKRRKAQKELETERANALRGMKTEIAALVADTVAKVVDDDSIPKNDQKLYDKFIAEAGEDDGAKVQ